MPKNLKITLIFVRTMISVKIEKHPRKKNKTVTHKYIIATFLVWTRLTLWFCHNVFQKKCVEQMKAIKVGIMGSLSQFFGGEDINAGVRG